MTSDAMPEDIIPDEVARALELFELAQPITRVRIEERYRDLLRIWHPHRYANLTNNPRKYMEMYKIGEVMTKVIESAYRVILAWLSRSVQ
jgi:hypothetical protein